MMAIGNDIRRGVVIVGALLITCSAWPQTIGEVRRELVRQRVPHAEAKYKVCCPSFVLNEKLKWWQKEK